MMTNREFIDKLERDSEALYVASEMQVEAFFKSNPSKEALVGHFSGRCMNEYLNMIEVAERLASLKPTGDRKMVLLLAKQVLDEATHFDLVAQVIEKLTGKPLDVTALMSRETQDGQAKGAHCLEGLSADDKLGLHAYQFIAEGRAHRVWKKMAEICSDPFIASTYKRIAEDEKFHHEIGRVGLEKALGSQDDLDRAQSLAEDMRHELYEVSCMNCVEVPEARALCVDAYGSRYLKH
jgi:1,2-phenylacetyl-CoA epoxidase catalytic subunit